MSRFTFIHAADLHLGSPLAGLALKDAEIARHFAMAGRRAFEDLVSRAIETQVAFMVVAGDIYDGDWTDATIGLFFARQVARLDRAGIPLVMVRGNHDAESVITRSIRLPDSVHVFPTPRADTHRLDHLRVALHGRSFPNRAVEENYALSYPAAVPGWFNIGVLHTSCDGHAAHATYAPCSIADLTGRGYDYWALGHIHEYGALARDPWIVFPGNLQGRSIRESGPKGAVCVEVADGRVSDVTRIYVDHARFARCEADLNGLTRETEALQAIEDALREPARAGGGRLLALRLTLTGETRLHDRLGADRDAFAAEVQAAAHRVHEDVWIEKLVVATHRPVAAVTSELPAEAGIDPLALLGAIEDEPDFRAKAIALIGEITAKMPGTLASETALADEIDDLLIEAEALVVGRLGTQRGPGCA